MALLTVSDDLPQLAKAAAKRVAALVQDAIRDRESAVVSLTGGTTAPYVYSALATLAARTNEDVSWRHVHVFWSDERLVPPFDADSNFGMASRTLLSRVPIPASQIHRVRGELMPDEAAAAYAAELGGRTFDLTLLSVGKDGHVASIFPGNPLVDEQSFDVRIVEPPTEGAKRITLTPAALLASRTILVLASGSRKAAAVAAGIDAPVDTNRWPVQLLRSAEGRVEWFVDREAARLVRLG